MVRGSSKRERQRHRQTTDEPAPRASSRPRPRPTPDEPDKKHPFSLGLSLRDWEIIDEYQDLKGMSTPSDAIRSAAIRQMKREIPLLKKMQ